MRSHVAVHIIKGETTGQVCGSCGILHSGNVEKILTKNKAFNPCTTETFGPLLSLFSSHSYPCFQGPWKQG